MTQRYNNEGGRPEALLEQADVATRSGTVDEFATLTFGGLCQSFYRHPYPHRHHHRAFRKRHEAKGNVTSAADTGTFELPLF